MSKGCLRLLRLFFLVCAVIFPLGIAHAAEPFILRISSENTANHIQTRIVQRFADTLAQRMQGRIQVEFSHSARLFRDRDVVAAMIEGKAEMAVLGSWQLDRFEPNFALLMLPIFYGRDAAIFHQIADGPIGVELNQRLERSIDVHVLGRWIDLGHAHLYFTKEPAARYPNLHGMRIRIAGGEANSARLEAFGAKARIIPWPDLANALEKGGVDGILSTHETIASTRLWESKILFSLEDREYFPQYVPLIASSFWKRLPQEMRAEIQSIWNENVEHARAEAAVAQSEARAVLLLHGVNIVTPTAKEIEQARHVAVAVQAKLVDKLGIDQRLLEQAITELQH